MRQSYAGIGRKGLHNASGYFHNSWILPFFRSSFCPFKCLFAQGKLSGKAQKLGLLTRESINIVDVCKNIDDISLSLA